MINAHAELQGGVSHHRQRKHHNQRQLPVNREHEYRGNDDAHQSVGGIDNAPREQFGHFFRIRGHARHDPPERGLAEVGQRELLQVVKQLFAQVVAHAFSLQASQEDEKERADGLDQYNRAVDSEEVQDGGLILRDNALIDDAFAENGEIRIQQRYDHNRKYPAKQGFPMRAQCIAQPL